MEDFQRLCEHFSQVDPEKTFLTFVCCITAQQ